MLPPWQEVLFERALGSEAIALADEEGRGQEHQLCIVHLLEHKPFGEEVGFILVLRLLVYRCAHDFVVLGISSLQANWHGTFEA